MKWRLYADLGNATLHWGISASGEWLGIARVDTSPDMAAPCAKSLVHLIEGVAVAAGDYSGGLICSSAPDFTGIVTHAVGDHLGRELPEMSVEHRELVATDYLDPCQVGADRLCNATAAATLHSDPCVVIDVGTCITAEVVRDGVLVGGAIAPGLPVMMAGFGTRATHLADFVAEMREPADLHAPGRSTEENLSLGVYTAVAGTAESLAENFVHDLQGPGIVLTGGMARWVCDHADIPATVDTILTLRGLKLLDESL
jgi:type III pantothenate kinase